MGIGQYMALIEPLTFDMFLQIREEIPELIMNRDVVTAAQILAQVRLPVPLSPPLNLLIDIPAAAL